MINSRQQFLDSEVATMTNRILLIAPMLVLLSGCATSYQPLGMSGGYTDLPLNATTYRVTYNGNGYTSATRLQNLLLYRCADLTLQNGYKYFIVLDSGSDHEDSYYTTPGYANSTSYANTNGYGTANTNYYGNQSYSNLNYNSNTTVNTQTTYTPPQTYTIRKYAMGAVIKLLKNNTSYPNAFDAQLIKNSLEVSIK